MRHHGLNIVAIGGGTGLSTLLRGLKRYVDADGAWSIEGLGASGIPFYLHTFLMRVDSFIRHTKNQERRKLPC